MTDRPLALVTGASHGIGAELARLFAEHGHDLIVTAEDAAIGDAAERLRRHGTDVTAVQADLSDPDGVEVVDIAVATAGRPLAAAALNAGVGSGGAFVGSDLADELRVIDLNVRSTVHLAHRVQKLIVAPAAANRAQLAFAVKNLVNDARII